MPSLVWQPWVLLRLLALAIPIVFAVAAALVPGRRREASLSRALPVAYVACGVAIAVAALSALVHPEPPAGGEGLVVRLAHAVRLDVVTHVMMLLVCFLATIIVRFSRTYLRGDNGGGLGREADRTSADARYARALLATLASVTTLILANNLLVIAIAWLAASLALHQLLTYYRERPQALIAAHKKFLVSRLADACMAGALVLIASGTESFDLDAINAIHTRTGAHSLSVEIGAVLVVLAVALKSAQLPFHGWLMQVMEAPTPVSALLHAGVVNIGGFVMIRLAPFMAHAPVAQTLLVVIGTVTAVVAALVMTTRISVKVTLAWSTCAQMGFMLVQCGLGLWPLALLHLVAHSLYKAHSFLSAGSVVDTWRGRAMAPARPRRDSPRRDFLVVTLLVLGLAGLLASAVVLREKSGTSGAVLPLILGLSSLPLVLTSLGRASRVAMRIALRGAGIGALYFVWHAMFDRLVDSARVAHPLGWAIFLSGFVALFFVELVVHVWPNGALARWVAPRFFAGLYLDELFTRATFRVWPPKLAPPASAREHATSIRPMTRFEVG